MLYEKLKEDLKSSLKNGVEERTGTLRLILSEVNNKQKEKYGADPKQLSDDEVAAVFQKEAKKRKEATELFRKGHRDDLVKKEEEELKIIEEYLPKQLTSEEIGAVIDRLAAGGLNDFNSLMREAMKELKGRADGRLVGELIKKKLQ